MQTRKLLVTLEHEDHAVPFDAFAKVLVEAVEILRGLDCHMIGAPRVSMRWNIVNVSMHSPIQMTLEPSPIHTDGRTVDVIIPFLGDFERLERGEKPQYFTPDLQARAKLIVSVLGRGIRSIRFNSEGHEARPTLRVAARVDELTERYFEIGSIEGSLEIISVHGEDAVTVWDARWNSRVKCLVSDAQLEQAKGLLRKRVMVRGRIKCEYKRPKEVVDVFDIQPLADSSSLPQVEDIAPVDLFGDSEPADYLRGQEDAE
jgi:hypothetical protein